MPKTLKLLKYAALLALAMLAAEVFWPRHYEVPQLANRAGTLYWDLPTGSRIAYTLVPAKGPKKTSPIIYLHGGPGGPISDLNIKLLSSFAEDGYDVYLYDQIGGGLSARLEQIVDYTAARHKKDLEAIVDKIGAQKVILIGQSWGAILATLYMADHPEKLEKVVFTGPGPIQPARPELRDLVAPDSIQLRAPIFTNQQSIQATQNLRSIATAFLAQRFGIKLASDQEADDFATFQGRLVNRSVVCDTTKFPPNLGGAGYYVQICTVYSLAELKDPRPGLKAVQCPVLVMKGQCDNQKWGFTKEYLDIFPNSRLAIIPNAGHAIGFEQPVLYLETIRSFLKQ